jgi:transposase-like protein
MLRGVSTRNYAPVASEYAKKLGISKSSCSRAFVRASQRALDGINHADLTSHRFVAVMVDGVEYGGRIVFVALGVTETLQKIPLGVHEGDTENADVVRDLLAGIVERGFTLHCERLLAVIDGSKALRRALLDVFGERVVIQRCWLHKLRNLNAYVPRQHHAQLYWRMKKLMGLVRHDEAIRELESFAHWLSQVSHDGAASLREAGRELVAVHALNLPRGLRQSLSSTNTIESLIGTVRERTTRVKNWKSRKTGQILRWVAASLRQHQPRMRRLRGHRDGAVLIAALGGERKLATQAQAA